MLTLEEIKAKTLYSGTLDTGATITGTEDVLKQYKVKTELVKADGQPLELRAFYLAYEYALKEIKDDYTIDEFYREWIDDPERFDPDNNISQFSLRTYFMLYEGKAASTNYKLVNYDGYSIGNHTLKAYVQALDALGDDEDFNYIEVIEEGIDTRLNTNIVKITIRCKDLDKVRKFAMLASRFEAEDVFARKGF